jgi:hypothetical protein
MLDRGQGWLLHLQTEGRPTGRPFWLRRQWPGTLAPTRARTQASRQISPAGLPRRGPLPGDCSCSNGKTPPETGTAPRARGMCGRSPSIAEGAAHFVNALVIEPAFRNTLSDRPAVGRQLIASDVVVPAFVMEHEEAHGVRVLIELIWIENDDTSCRHAQAGQARIENVAHVAAPECPASDEQFSTTPQIDGRRRARQVAVGTYQPSHSVHRRARQEAVEAYQ